MCESRCGSIFVREPDQLLDTGHVVEGHTHNFHHMTNFTRGKWRCQRFGRIVGTEDGWHKISDVTIQGGTPGARIGIEADMKHRFELLEGPGHYQCIYSHRDPEDGRVVEEYTGWHEAYV